MKKLMIHGIIVLSVFLQSMPIAAMIPVENEEVHHANPQEGRNSSWWENFKSSASNVYKDFSDRLSGTLSTIGTTGQKAYVSAYKRTNETIDTVRNWDWTKTLGILVAIAAAYGIIIKLYNENGELLNTISSKGYELFGIVVPAAGMVASPLGNEVVNSITNSLSLKAVKGVVDQVESRIDQVGTGLGQVVGSSWGALADRVTRLRSGNESRSEEIAIGKLGKDRNMIRSWVKDEGNGSMRVWARLIMLKNIAEGVMIEPAGFPTGLAAPQMTIEHMEHILRKERISDDKDLIIQWVEAQGSDARQQSLELLEQVYDKKANLPKGLSVCLDYSDEALKEALNHLKK